MNAVSLCAQVYHFMLSRISFLFLVLFFFQTINSFSQVRVIKFDEVEQLLKNKTDTTFILNFWATWCKPCVTELPYFEKLDSTYKSSRLHVVLVSLDFKRDFETRLKSFVERNKITSEVLLLDEPDYNSWINKVDSSWSGAIPATIIISENHKSFFEKEFTSYTELENTVKPLIKN